MKKYKIISGLTLILIIVTLNGCIEDEIGNIQIKGKGYFDTIQKAIDAASNNDKILVYNGIYNEKLTINKSISLIAVDKDITTIQYSGYLSNISVIEINGDNCIIDGFIISEGNKSIKSTAIEINSNNNIIINNTIQDFYYGIYLYHSNNNIITNNFVDNNAIGINTVFSMECKILLNNITKNNVYGIYVSSRSDDNLFKYNQISQNSIGLRVKGSRRNIFENNIVKNNNDKGFYICCGAAKNIVFNNSIIDNNQNADDHYDNQWYYNNTGNYWSDYNEKYPDATDENNDGIWDTPYSIYEFDEKIDMFPLIKPVKI